jgi:hypothetical protein
MNHVHHKSHSEGGTPHTPQTSAMIFVLGLHGVVFTFKLRGATRMAANTVPPGLLRYVQPTRMLASAYGGKQIVTGSGRVGPLSSALPSSLRGMCWRTASSGRRGKSSDAE